MSYKTLRVLYKLYRSYVAGRQEFEFESYLSRAGDGQSRPRGSTCSTCPAHVLWIQRGVALCVLLPSWPVRQSSIAAGRAITNRDTIFAVLHYDSPDKDRFLAWPMAPRLNGLKRLIER